MKIHVQCGMYYFLTEDEAFKVLLTMGHLSNQKDKTKEQSGAEIRESRLYR